jgi:hypothetical protein
VPDVPHGIEIHARDDADQPISGFDYRQQLDAAPVEQSQCIFDTLVACDASDGTAHHVRARQFHERAEVRLLFEMVTQLLQADHVRLARLRAPLKKLSRVEQFSSPAKTGKPPGEVKLG